MYCSLDTWRQSGFFGSQAIYPAKGLEVLEEVGLHHLLEKPSAAKVAEHDFEVIGSGAFANVLEIDGSGIVVKQHQPWINDDLWPKHVSGRALLRDLSVNVALEESLTGNEKYTTPQYLGHLMLRGPRGRRWHYTVMSKLDMVDLSSDAREQWDRTSWASQSDCDTALREAGYNARLVDWDGTYLGHNVRLVNTPDGYRLAIFDQGHLLSGWNRPKPFAKLLKTNLDHGIIRDPLTRTCQEKTTVYDGF